MNIKDFALKADYIRKEKKTLLNIYKVHYKSAI